VKGCLRGLAAPLFDQGSASATGTKRISKFITYVVVDSMGQWRSLGQRSYDLRRRRCCAVMPQVQGTVVHWRHVIVGVSLKRSDLET
jgi:hypothetical protein